MSEPKYAWATNPGTRSPLPKQYQDEVDKIKMDEARHLLFLEDILGELLDDGDQMTDEDLRAIETRLLTAQAHGIALYNGMPTHPFVWAMVKSAPTDIALLLAEVRRLQAFLSNEENDE